MNSREELGFHEVKVLWFCPSWGTLGGSVQYVVSLSNRTTFETEVSKKPEVAVSVQFLIIAGTDSGELTVLLLLGSYKLLNNGMSLQLDLTPFPLKPENAGSAIQCLVNMCFAPRNCVHKSRSPFLMRQHWRLILKERQNDANSSPLAFVQCIVLASHYHLGYVLVV